MSKTLEIKKIKAFSTFISIKENEWKRQDGTTGWECSGYYWGKTRCVRIYGCGPYKEKYYYTIRIELRIDGIEYERTYLKKFSERGLQLICARLIRDTEKLHLKNKKRKI